MKEIKRLQKIALVVSMIILLSAGCAGTSDAESRPVETGAIETAQPTATAGSTADLNLDETPEDTPNPDVYTDDNGYHHHDNTKWYYDKKNKRLTISGTGDMFEDEEGGYRPPEIYPNHTYISKAQRNAKEIVVESGITSISEEAFYGFRQVEKITLPDTLQRISDKVFWCCESLKEVVIPGQVKTIGRNCFSWCKSLQKITIGKSLATIGEGAFMDCPNIRKVKVSPKNKYFVTKNGGLYQKKDKTLYLHYAKSEQVKIEKGTRRIGEFALQWNENVRQITIPASVRTIGGGAMLNCSNLKKIIFPKQSQLKEIEQYGWIDESDWGAYDCFKGCEKLQEFISPESLERIPQSAFTSCDSLKRIYLGKNFKGYPGDAEGHQYHQVYEFTESSRSLKEYIVSKDNEAFCSKGGVLYDKKMETLFVYPVQKSGAEYTIPESVKYVINLSLNYKKGSKLRKLVVPGKDTRFDTGNLPKNSKRLTIYGRKDSGAYRAAIKRKIKFVEL